MACTRLSRHQPASFKELASIAIPFAGSLLSSYLLVVTDRLLLSNYSVQALEASAAAFAFFFPFQMLIHRFVSTIQSYVGQSLGENNPKEALSYTWQMILLSFFLPFVIIPTVLLLGTEYFKHSPVEHEALTYLKYISYGSFLFALDGTLSSFFLGMGQSKKVLKVHAISHLCNVTISSLLIYGVKDFIPPLGVHGAAIGTVASKGLSCLLMTLFLKKSHQTSVHEVAKLSMKKIYKCIQNALPRAVGQGVLIFAWNYAARILVQSGGIDLLVFSFGTSLFIPILGEAVGAAVLSSTSYLIGSKQLLLIPKMVRSASLLTLCSSIILAIPLFLFSHQIIYGFFRESIDLISYKILTQTCHILWIAFLVNNFYLIAFMMLTAFKDMRFYLIAHVTITPIPLFLAVKYLYIQSYWNPNYFWILTILQSATMLFVYSLRLSKLLQKALYHNNASSTDSLGSPSVQ